MAGNLGAIAVVPLRLTGGRGGPPVGLGVLTPSALSTGPVKVSHAKHNFPGFPGYRKMQMRICPYFACWAGVNEAISFVRRIEQSGPGVGRFALVPV